MIARSFSRIFYRNAVNLGIPLLECKEDNIAEEGDELKVDVKAGAIENVSRCVSYPAMPLTDYMMQILECGGAVSMMKTKTVVVIATGGTIAGVRDNERVRHTIQGSWQSFLIIWVPVRMWPVVLTGAMRPAADVSPDDPRNLKQAV